MHDRSLSCLGTGTSIKSGGIKAVAWDQTSLLCLEYLIHRDNKVNNDITEILLKVALNTIALTLKLISST